MSTERWSGFSIATRLLTTEMDSLASLYYSDPGTVYDNSGTPEGWGILELNISYGSAPTDGVTIDVFLLPAPDGAHYADGAHTRRPSSEQYIGSFQLTNVTGAQKLMTSLFQLPPCKFKIMVFNNTGGALPSSGTTIDLYTTSRTIV